MHNDDEVSSDDDVLLQRRMRAADSGGSAVDRPPLAATAPWPDSSMVVLATTPEGSGGSSTVGDALVATRAAAEKETVDVVAVKKVVDDAAAVKKAADEATTVKKAADDVTATKKSIDNTTAVKKAADEAAMVKKAANDTTAAKKAADNAVIVSSGSSSSLLLGANRAVAPSGSTPPTMRHFLGSWKPRYITQIFIYHFLYCIYDFDLVLLAYSVSSSGRSPPSGGSSIAGAPKAGGPQDTVEAHGSKGPTVGAVGGDWVPVSGAAVAVGVVALEVVTGDGSPIPEVLPEGDINATVGAMAVGDLAASIGPVGGTSPSIAVGDDDVTMEEAGDILGHPIRVLGDVSLDKAMGMARWALTQAHDVLRRESGGINDEWWHLLLWASMQKERTMTEKARAEARQ
jgi:hypothetical protein